MCIFLQFCADLSNKPKSNKAIYLYASKRSPYVLSETGIVCYAMAYCFRVLGFAAEEFCLFSAESASC